MKETEKLENNIKFPSEQEYNLGIIEEPTLYLIQIDIKERMRYLEQDIKKTDDMIKKLKIKSAITKINLNNMNTFNSYDSLLEQEIIVAASYIAATIANNADMSNPAVWVVGLATFGALNVLVRFQRKMKINFLNNMQFMFIEQNNEQKNELDYLCKKVDKTDKILKKSKVI